MTVYPVAHYKTGGMDPCAVAVCSDKLPASVQEHKLIADGLT